MRRSVFSSACLLAITSFAVHAQTAAPTLGEVTVTTPRGVEPVFDVAGSVDRVEGSDIRDMRLQAQLSEGLSAVPGLQIQNRQNLAQDLQISIRG
ncbi:TonB-dependent siderophore receptor, partial [Variovorax sp. J2P1-59]|nr:TonB-dependent siderophore receptor [Variovorax sp. J2P1-59]